MKKTSRPVQDGIDEKSRRGARSASLSVRGEGESKEVRASISSETADVVRWVYDEELREWIRAREVLGHRDGEVDFSRCENGLVIQDTHYGDQIGIIREPSVADGKLGGVIEFCCGQRAQEIRRDALAGIRTNMSVGYYVKRWKKVADPSPETDNLPVYRAVEWTPYEASFVPVPADTQVGVGREDVTPSAVADPNERKAEMQTNKTPKAATPTAEPETRAAAPASPAVAPEAPAAEPAPDPRDAEIARLRAEITELKKPAAPAPKARGFVFDEDGAREINKRYSLMRVIRTLVAVHNGSRGEDVGFEREISDEIAKKTGRDASGFFVPDQVLMPRAFDKANAAGSLVATDTLFGELVPALVAKTILGQAGVRTLAGLVGDVKIPTAGGATAYWVSSEGGNATETTPQIGQIPATPHTVGAFTDITRKLLAQSGIGAEAFVADALRSALARAIEAAAFAGTGADGQPTGLVTLADARAINTVANATSPTLAKLLEFITAIETANADGASMKFVGTPAVWALLGSTLDIATIEASGTNVGGVTSGKYLLDTASNMSQGYPFLKGNLVPAKTLFFGDWSKLLLAFWSGIDLTVDPYALSKSGGVRVVALQDMDVVVTQPKAFSKGQVIA